jgi:hypothetical protein
MTATLKVETYDLAPVLSDGTAWFWRDPWDERHGPYSSQDQAYDAYVAQTEAWQSLAPAHALDTIHALIVENERLANLLAERRGWQIMRAIECALGLHYDVMRDTWTIPDGTAHPPSDRDLCAALRIALAIRVAAARALPVTPALPVPPDHPSHALRRTNCFSPAPAPPPPLAPTHAKPCTTATKPATPRA